LSTAIVFVGAKRGICAQERALDEPQNVRIDEAPPREPPSIGCWPVVAVIAIALFSLVLIAFLVTLHSR
jgi:hypothetical protein